MNKGIFDIHVIDVYFTAVHSSHWVFDTGLVAKICNLKQELQNLIVKGICISHEESNSNKNKRSLC